MKVVAAVLGAFLAVIAAVAIWGIGAYNGLVGKQEAVNASWGQVQNVYQRRADLVPNLVATVQGARERRGPQGRQIGARRPPGFPEVRGGAEPVGRGVEPPARRHREVPGY